MSTHLDVMISSTARDLPEHRQAAMNAILSLGLHPQMMEHLPASPADAIDASLKMVDEAEIYVGIFAHRYGYVPRSPKNPDKISVTEMEYRRAVERGIPIYIFVMGDDHPVFVADVETKSGASKLKKFKAHLTTAHVVKFFKSPADLEAKISQTLAQHKPSTAPSLPANRAYSPPPPPSPDALAEHGELPPGSKLIFARNAFFTGREDDLQRLANALLHRPNGKPLTVTAATTAPGGMGKTQLAVEFAYRYGRFFHGVHWMSAIGERLDPEIAACGYDMNLPDFPNEQDAQIRLVLAEWDKTAPRLLIVDNAEDPDTLQKLLPKLRGHRILITSRRNQWPREWCVTHQLDVLMPDQARALLRKLAPHLASAPDADLDKVGEKLGHLPLALDLAGRYMDGRHMTPTEYLDLLKKQAVLTHKSFTDWAAQADISSPTEHEMNLYASFDLSWQRLENDAARRVFIGCGYLAPNSPIPKELLHALVETDAENDDPAETLDLALIHLENVGLLTREDGATLPTIHPLLAEFACHQVVEGGDVLAVLADWMARLAKQATDTGLPAPFAPLRPHIERLAEYAENRGNEGAGVLWNNLGYHLNMLADYAGAQAAYERALRIDEANFGPDHPKVAIRVNNLAGVLYTKGDLAGAQAAFERALRIDEANFGPDHPKVAIRVNNLGLVLKVLGDYPAAQTAYERALRIDEANFGSTHPDVATDVNNLAGVLYAKGDLAGAQAAYERALRIWEANLGPTHPQVAVGVNNLGLVLKTMGDLAGAQAAFERALRIGEANFGPTHPNVAIRLLNLGALRYQKGDLTTAQTHLERALRIFRQFLPAGHPDIANTQAWLDDVNQALGQGS